MSALRADLPRKHKFTFDLLYIEKHTFWLDLKLIPLTFWMTFRGKWEARGEKRWPRTAGELH